MRQLKGRRLTQRIARYVCGSRATCSVIGRRQQVLAARRLLPPLPVSGALSPPRRAAASPAASPASRAAAARGSRPPARPWSWHWPPGRAAPAALAPGRAAPSALASRSRCARGARFRSRCVRCIRSRSRCVCVCSASADPMSVFCRAWILSSRCCSRSCRTNTLTPHARTPCRPCMVRSNVLRSTRHKIGHFSETFFPANLLAWYWKKNKKPTKLANNIKPV